MTEIMEYKYVHIAVMDYCSGCIKMYTVRMKNNWQTEDVEEWLLDNTDFKSDQCYYMASEKAIEVDYLEV